MLVFFSKKKGPIEVTQICNHFKCMWFGIPKIIKNKLYLKSEQNLFFYILLGIHKYIYMIQSICVGMVSYPWACQE